MQKSNEGLWGLLSLNGSIERNMQFRKKYNFTTIFNNQKKEIQKKFKIKLVNHIKRTVTRIETFIENKLITYTTGVQ
ncbi:hypothetical protein ACFL1T_03905 [Chlamydiota bacterium]